MKLGLALLLVTSALLEQGSSGGPPGKVILLKKFEAMYRSSKTLRATFLERYFDNGKLVRSEAGVAYFAKPGKMRWEYQSPEANLYLVDGKWSWFYVPGDHTATRVRAKESADERTPFALLAGEMKVSRICKSVELEGSVRASDPDGVVLRCKLRGSEDLVPSLRTAPDVGSPQGDYILFELKAANGELRRVVVVDRGGVQVEFLFDGWQFDPGVEDSKFRFSPPKGVAIVDGDLATSSRAAGRAQIQ
jgi:outer membrane lipoprotein carrier protein